MTPDSKVAAPTPAERRPGQAAIVARLVALARPVFAALIVAAIVYAVVADWSQVRSALATLAWPDVSLSVLAALAGTMTSVLAWRALLTDEGHRLTPIVSGRIFLVGQLGKYLPGSVWSVVLQMELARRAGVPRARAFTASLAFVGLSLSTGLCVGLVGLPVLLDAHAGEAWLLVAALPVAVVASTPPMLTRLLNLILRVARKDPLPHALSWRGVLSAAAWLTATWGFFGLHLWLLADALGAPGWSGLSRCVGGFSLAMSAGVLFLVVPSGAGVREALIVAALAPVMPSGAALGIAVVSRAVFILADVVSAGLAALSARALTRSPRSATTQPDDPVGNAPDCAPTGSTGGPVGARSGAA